MLPVYKTYRPDEFVDRVSELESTQKLMEEKSRAAIIIEGERGSGKTSLLFELYRQLNEKSELRPFLVSLFPYSAPVFETRPNLWINTERPFQIGDIPDLLDRLARYLEIDFIKSKDPNIQKEYFARGLAYGSARKTPVLLMDSIYECPEDIRVEIEKYILAPILTSEKVSVILTGRGKRPVWSRPELQAAEIIDLPPLQDIYVKEQLEKMKSANTARYQEIAELSGGYPLIVYVMGKSEKSLIDSLDEAIDIIIRETLAEDWQEDEKYNELRAQIEKLSLVDIPFRIPDVEDYLFPADPEQRTKTNDLVNLLLASHILRFEGKGYRLNKSVVHPIRKWLLGRRHPVYEQNLNQLTRVSRKLQENYPSAKAWYQRMLPGNSFPPAKPLSNHIMGLNKS